MVGVVFSSIIFLSVFLPIFLLVYYASGKSNVVVLLFSLVFYAWGGPNLLPLLLFYIIWNYVFGLLIEKASTHRRAILSLGLAGNLAGLLYFKYLGFVAGQISTALSLFNVTSLPEFHIVLPLGISFFSFQAISYLIDIYRGDVKAQKSCLTFATYKAMFPQLIAGPIVRYSQLAEELDARSVDAERLSYGILIFVVGLAQKTLIANPLAAPADQIFALQPEQLTVATAWLGVLCYTGQIYFDFCGYSNIAIGLGHMMGFTLPPNFNRPYIAQSATEFWRRWHISLSTWFRDYLYIPLGGNRKSERRTYFNLATVFVLCGLWHGASWIFLLWGVYWGILLAAERAGLGRIVQGLWRPLRHVYLLLAVMFGWIIFRADTPTHAVAIMKAMGGFGAGNSFDTPIEQYFGRSVAITLAVAACASALPSSPAKIPPLDLRELSRVRLAAGIAARTAVLALVIVCLFSVGSGSYNPFIYFRF
jgi:alginate O-acetyltransferase complex protein AlgI